MIHGSCSWNHFKKTDPRKTNFWGSPQFPGELDFFMTRCDSESQCHNVTGSSTFQPLTPFASAVHAVHAARSTDITPYSSSFLERLILFCASISVTLTFTTSPTFITSSTFSTLSLAILEMCSRPSLPGRISMNAPTEPLAVDKIRVTLPS